MESFCLKRPFTAINEMGPGLLWVQPRWTKVPQSAGS